MIKTVVCGVLVGLFLNGSAADVCAAAFFALAKVFFAFVAAGVAAVVLGAHVRMRSRKKW